MKTSTSFWYFRRYTTATLFLWSNGTSHRFQRCALHPNSPEDKTSEKRDCNVEKRRQQKAQLRKRKTKVPTYLLRCKSNLTITTLVPFKSIYSYLYAIPIHLFCLSERKLKVTYFDRFNLYLKLLLAMGLNWAMEVISWIFEWQVKDLPKTVWILTDTCNALYGVFIFFIFVFKRNIWNHLQRRYGINQHISFGK